MKKKTKELEDQQLAIARAEEAVKEAEKEARKVIRIRKDYKD